MSKRNLKDTAQFALDNMKKNGATSAGVTISSTTKYELNVDHDDIVLYRTTDNVNLSLRALVGTKNGVVRSNKLLDDAILENCKNAVTLANSNAEDDGQFISPAQPPASLSIGDEKPNSELMYQRLREFLDYTKKTYPTLKFDSCVLSFDLVNRIHANTNGVLLNEKIGSYIFSPMFFAKDKNGTSSFNASGATHLNLDTPLKDWANLNELMKESCEQTKTEKVGGSFVGDLVLTPSTSAEFIQLIQYQFLGDIGLVTGSSIWKDKLNQEVVSKLLSVSAKPEVGGVEIPSLITGDGHVAKNTNLIESGVLKSFWLSDYGQKKTGIMRCPANGTDSLVIAPGTTPLRDLIKNVKKGILLQRFSGGQPAPNGDFSGVAKNSYLIENGVITKPLSETMIAGNIADVLKNIVSISSETINYGTTMAPWIHSTGITISG